MDWKLLAPPKSARPTESASALLPDCISLLKVLLRSLLKVASGTVQRCTACWELVASLSEQQYFISAVLKIPAITHWYDKLEQLRK